MEGMIGEVRMFAGNFAPRSWAFCDGQLLPINQNQALFSILGTMYGGDGRTTFALPDLRGRMPVGTGQGPGLSPNRQGDEGGAENVTLTEANLPPHTHSGSFDTDTEEGSPRSRKAVQTTTARATGTLPVNLDNTGGNQPFSIMPPHLSIRFIICLQGLFPSRS